MTELRPIIFDPKQETLDQFKQKYRVDIVLDDYEKQLEELFLIRNPKARFVQDYSEDLKSFIKTDSAGINLDMLGNWFYFDWNKTLVHFLSEADYIEVKTARNKNLITKAEQDKFYNCTIAIAGLSVGSHAALTIAMMGGSKKIKLADPDTVSFANLNRLRYGSTVFGTNKAVYAGRIILEMNPYSIVEIYDQGIKSDQMDNFFANTDILIEETDSMEMKIVLREEAKNRKIPVIMATDNGDGVIVDVERYDLEPSLQIFNGALGDFDLNKFREFPPTELPKLAAKIAGEEYIVDRMKMSLMEVGKTLYSWPQLGTAATFSGVVIAYLVRKIANSDTVKSGKYDLNMDKFFNND